MAVLVLDWRNSLPRTLGSYGYYFETRSKAARGWIVHHAAGEHDVDAINAYHQAKDWGNGARAPHIAYHVFIPKDPVAWAQEWGVTLPDDTTSIIVVCNYAWERGWHATDANDEYWGACLQLNGLTTEPSGAQREALQYVVDGRLDTLSMHEFYKPAGQLVWGHRQLGPTSPAWWNSSLFGAWRDYNNATSCPGDYVQIYVYEYQVNRTPFWVEPITPQGVDDMMTEAQYRSLIRIAAPIGFWRAGEQPMTLQDLDAQLVKWGGAFRNIDQDVFDDELWKIKNGQ